MTRNFHKTFRLTSIYAIGNVLRKAVQLFLIPVTTTFIMPEQIGPLYLLNLVFVLLGLFITTPIVSGALERYYYHPQYQNRNGELLFNLFLLLMVQSLVIGGLFYLLAPWINQFMIGDPALLPIVQLYALLLAIWPVWSICLSIIKLREMAIYFAAITICGTILSALITIVGLKYFDLGIHAVIYALIADFGIACLLGLPVLIKYMQPRFSLSIVIEPLRFGYPFLPSGFARLLMQVSDRFFLGKFCSFGQVGVYGFGFGIAEAIDSGIVNPLFNGVMPTIRMLEHDPQRQKTFISHAATVYYGLAVFVALALSLLSREAVMLLGRQEGYWPAQFVVPIIAFAFVQQALGLFLDWGLIMRNKSLHLSGILLASAGINIILDLLLIPKLGFIGAGFAMAATWIILNIMKMYLSARFYQLHFELRRLLHITVLGLGIYFASMLLPMAENIMQAVAIKLGLAAAFPVACLLTGVLSGAEKQFLVQLLTRKKKAELVIEELEATKNIRKD